MSLSVPISNTFDYKSIKQWKNSLSEFYKKYYDDQSAEIIKKLEMYEQNYFILRKEIEIKEIANDFATLLNIILNKGLKKRCEEVNFPFNSTLPMWY